MTISLSLKPHTHWAILDTRMFMFDLNQRPILWAIVVPIQIKHVHSSLSYQQATHRKYDRRGQESPSGYCP